MFSLQEPNFPCMFLELLRLFISHLQITQSLDDQNVCDFFTLNTIHETSFALVHFCFNFNILDSLVEVKTCSLCLLVLHISYFVMTWLFPCGYLMVQVQTRTEKALCTLPYRQLHAFLHFSTLLRPRCGISFIYVSVNMHGVTVISNFAGSPTCSLTSNS